VKYFKKSLGRLVKFEEIATQLGVSTKQLLCIDVKMRWNSTFHMLDAVIHYKMTFRGYALRDSNFEWLSDVVEWKKAEKVSKLFMVFSETTKIFSKKNYPISNLLFRLTRACHMAASY
jgi:hypothetical protein